MIYWYIAIIKGMNGKTGFVQFNVPGFEGMGDNQTQEEYAGWYYLNCVDDSSELIACVDKDKWEGEFDQVPTSKSLIDDAWQRSSQHWPI